MSSLRAYSRLPQHAGDGVDDAVNDVELKEASHTHRTYNLTLSRTAIIISLLCALLNVALFLSRPAPSPDFSPFSHERTDALPRPNPYIGLERVRRNRTIRLAPIVNFGPVLTQVSSEKPDRIFPDDVRRYFDPAAGTISPDDRRIVVNNTTNSIAQWRVRDWGMEHCRLVLSLPPPSTALAQNVTLHPHSVSIDVFNLTTPDARFLDVRTLSWSTRPARQSPGPVATMALGTESASGEAASELFWCLRDSVHTYEFACGAATPECGIDFWQDGASTEPAMYMRQYDSAGCKDLKC